MYMNIKYDLGMMHLYFKATEDSSFAHTVGFQIGPTFSDLQPFIKWKTYFALELENVQKKAVVVKIHYYNTFWSSFTSYCHI